MALLQVARNLHVLFSRKFRSALADWRFMIVCFALFSATKPMLSLSQSAADHLSHPNTSQHPHAEQHPHALKKQAHTVLDHSKNKPAKLSLKNVDIFSPLPENFNFLDEAYTTEQWSALQHKLDVDMALGAWVNSWNLPYFRPIYHNPAVASKRMLGLCYESNENRGIFYSWQPTSKRPFLHWDAEMMCRMADGRNIGFIGDSMSQQFFHTFVSAMRSDTHDFLSQQEQQQERQQQEEEEQPPVGHVKQQNRRLRQQQSHYKQEEEMEQKQQNQMQHLLEQQQQNQQLRKLSQTKDNQNDFDGDDNNVDNNIAEVTAAAAAVVVDDEAPLHGSDSTPTARERTEGEEKIQQQKDYLHANRSSEFEFFETTVFCPGNIPNFNIRFFSSPHLSPTVASLSHSPLPTSVYDLSTSFHSFQPLPPKVSPSSLSSTRASLTLAEELREFHPGIVILNTGAHFLPDIEELFRNIRHLLNFLYITFPDISVVYRSSSLTHDHCEESVYFPPLMSPPPLRRTPSAAALKYHWQSYGERNNEINSFLSQYFPQVLRLNIHHSQALRSDGHCGKTIQQTKSDDFEYFIALERGEFPGNRTMVEDCLHMCVPGPINEWVVQLYNALLRSAGTKKRKRRSGQGGAIDDEEKESQKEETFGADLTQESEFDADLGEEWVEIAQDFLKLRDDRLFASFDRNFSASQPLPSSYVAPSVRKLVSQQGYPHQLIKVLKHDSLYLLAFGKRHYLRTAEERVKWWTRLGKHEAQIINFWDMYTIPVGRPLP